MGGSDDPSNLVVLSVEEHAEAHRLLWEKHGLKEDYLAWKGLSGAIGKEEIILEKSKIGGFKSKGRKKSPEELKKLSDSWTVQRKEQLAELSKQRFTGKPKSIQHVEKMKLVKKSQEEIQRMKLTQINNNFGGKRIMTPMGIFQSIKDCSRKTNVSVNTIKYRAKNNLFGYKFMNGSE
jgi:hypothetical protein